MKKVKKRVRIHRWFEGTIADFQQALTEFQLDYNYNFPHTNPYMTTVEVPVRDSNPEKKRVYDLFEGIRRLFSLIAVESYSSNKTRLTVYGVEDSAIQFLECFLTHLDSAGFTQPLNMKGIHNDKNLALSKKRNADSLHFAHPKEKRMQIVEEFRKARTQGLVENKATFVKNHYKIVLRTFNRYVKEYDEDKKKELVDK